METYCIKLLMQYEILFIADLFCGSGYNGKEKGSPLLLIDILNKVLSDNTLLTHKPNSKVYLLLNDNEKENIEILGKNLNGYIVNPRISILKLSSEFKDILLSIKKYSLGFSIPKFFFLDPFKYSIVSLNNIKDLMKLGTTEILLFSPVFAAYRFKTSKNIVEQENHKTRKFIEDFTSRGIDDYEDIYDFNNSITEKLRQELDQELDIIFAKYILLDNGSRKNALFHITDHPAGSILFTKISRKLGDYGMGIDIKFKEKVKTHGCLFGVEECSTHNLLSSFEIFIIGKLKEQKLSNIDITIIATINGFEPSEANEILKKYKNQINIEYLTEKKRGFYVSESGRKEPKKCLISFKK